ncbi:hypothetical protein [Pedosphaera parvula]|uniref:Uncharacterized protein n=1 Tax=Pedosphaera parvula (strain Ellin514) TaxID=320771 RepID=B9XIC2_PEDPL|nr:hypothetical protein [Pedosphaera parvula]EEF60383.1 hypothetical protein Cflav_PD3353 [Pedosphaera parvula Ellin514]
MRVILQNTKTLLYYQATEAWTPDPALAKDFVNMKIASYFVQGMKAGTVDIIMDLGAYTYNARLLSTMKKSVQTGSTNRLQS